MDVHLDTTKNQTHIIIHFYYDIKNYDEKVEHYKYTLYECVT